MRISQNGVDLIKHFESLRLTAYPDPATGNKPWTIGYGSTEGVVKGMTITQQQAEQMLEKDLLNFETGVNKIAKNCTQSQFDALCSFSFNLGLINLERSTLLRLHNAEKYSEVPAQFLRWNRANGAVMAGLTRRRTAESLLYAGKDWDQHE